MCIRYTEHKRGSKLVVSVHQEFPAIGDFFFGQFYPMPMGGPRLEEPKNRGVVRVV